MPAPTSFPLANLLGMNGAIYANTGTHSTPVWSLMDDVKDVDLGFSTDAFEASIRRTVPFKVYVPTLIDMNPKFKIAWIPTDAFCIALLAAKLNSTTSDLIFLDGLISVPGSQGLRADWMVSKFDKAEHLTEGQEYDVELKPALTANKPSYFVAP